MKEFYRGSGKREFKRLTVRLYPDDQEAIQALRMKHNIPDRIHAVQIIKMLLKGKIKP